MTTKSLILEYARHLRKAQSWQAGADTLRDQIAERIKREGNFRNGSLATRYKVKGSVVRRHERRGFSAMRITP